MTAFGVVFVFLRNASSITTASESNRYTSRHVVFTSRPASAARSRSAVECYRGLRIENGQTGATEPPIASDDRDTSCLLRCDRADGVFEVGPSQGRRLLQHASVHGGDSEYGQDVGQAAIREFAATPSTDEVVQRRDRMRRQDCLDTARLREGPERRGRVDEGRPVEEHVENDVQVDEDSSHRYFLTR